MGCNRPIRNAEIMSRWINTWLIIDRYLSEKLTHCKATAKYLRGYCTPGQFLDCFCIFLKNYNTLVTSKICFLQATYQGTWLLHWNFITSSGYWFMTQNMENIDFCTFFTVTPWQWSLCKWNCDFWVPWNISDQIHRILCPKLLYFLRKCTKSSKIRPRGAVPP